MNYLWVLKLKKCRRASRLLLHIELYIDIDSIMLLFNLTNMLKVDFEVYFQINTVYYS